MDSISFNTSMYNSFHNNMHRKRLLLELLWVRAAYIRDIA